MPEKTKNNTFLLPHNCYPPFDWSLKLGFSPDHDCSWSILWLNVCFWCVCINICIFQEVKTESLKPKLFHVSPNQDFCRWRAFGLICSCLHPLGVIQCVSCLFVSWWGIKMNLKDSWKNWNMSRIFLVIPPPSPSSSWHLYLPSHYAKPPLARWPLSVWGWHAECALKTLPSYWLGELFPSHHLIFGTVRINHLILLLWH